MELARRLASLGLDVIEQLARRLVVARSSELGGEPDENIQIAYFASLFANASDRFKHTAAAWLVLKRQGMDRSFEAAASGAQLMNTFRRG